MCGSLGAARKGEAGVTLSPRLWGAHTAPGTIASLHGLMLLCPQSHPISPATGRTFLYLLPMGCPCASVKGAMTPAFWIGLEEGLSEVASSN